MPTSAEESGGLRPVLWVACWSALFLLYEVLAGSPSGPEAAAGAVGSLLATLAVMSSGHRDHLGRMRWRWWLRLADIPGRVIADTWRVLEAAVGPRAPSGRFRSLPFEAGGDDPVSGSRRALVIAFASIAPNSYVVRIDEDGKGLLTHQLVRVDDTPGDGDQEWPI